METVQLTISHKPTPRKPTSHHNSK